MPVSVDHAMMRQCFDLSRKAAREGEYPYGAVVADGDTVLAAATQRVAHEGDVSRHAEIVAMVQAQHKRGGRKLAGCTLYATVEPCPMCAFALRELRISRVVYALGSPVMGGVSKWDVAVDHGLSDAMPEVFGPVPDIVPGVLSDEAQAVWRDWNPLLWRIIRAKGFLAADAPHVFQVAQTPAPHRHWVRNLIASFLG